MLSKHIKITTDLILSKRTKASLFRLFLMYSNPLWRMAGVTVKEMKESCAVQAKEADEADAQYFRRKATDTARMVATVSAIQDKKIEMRLMATRINYKIIRLRNTNSNRIATQNEVT